MKYFLQCATLSHLKDLKKKKNPSTKNVKEKNHPKIKIHYLLTPVLMESQVKILYCT